MADVNTGGGGGGKHEKKRAKKSSTRIDMTPMVDLAFLLLTFFVMTSTFSKPKVMEIPFPKDSEKKEDQIKVNNAITFILTKDDGIYYYNGEFYPEGNTKGQPPTKLTKTNYSADGLHKLLLDRNKTTIDAIKALEEKRLRKEISDTTYQRLAIAEQGRKGVPGGKEAALTVLIKTDDKAVYKNVVDVIDEIKICNIGIYAVVDMMPKELELLNAINK
ncbi:MAG: Biopolymer transport protein ExbD/TolR [Bacteroidetes bacterium]|jgi:biopolymer transport protein ExbD|nr:Biopolymer transport protein ExbD/TolR [Bacteroidota bacterium]